MLACRPDKLSVDGRVRTREIREFVIVSAILSATTELPRARLEQCHINVRAEGADVIALTLCSYEAAIHHHLQSLLH